MTMIEFTVQDMTCAHCVATITKALKGVDPQALCEFDLEAHRVMVHSTLARERFASAITGAGFTPSPVAPG